jgi:thioredoxin-like negative regulator of GroEL
VTTRAARERDAGFELVGEGHHAEVTSTTTATEQRNLPILLFVGQHRSGPSRRMESLVAWVKVSQKSRLRVIQVDADRRMDLVRRFGIREVPSLVLIDRRRVVGRLEGRATGNQIDELIRSHLPA